MLKLLLGVVVLASSALAQDGSARAQAAAFVKLLGDDNLGPVAARSLEKMGEAAVPALIDALNDLNSNGRDAAAALLGKIAGESKPAKDALLDATESRDAKARVAACSALLANGEKTPAAISGLAAGLSANDVAVRRAAADALKNAGADGKGAIPDLLGALDDKDAGVRKAASDALKGMGVAILDTAGNQTGSDSAVQRAMAVTAIGRMGAAKHAPKLAGMLKDDSRRVRVAAATALGRIGKDVGNHADAVTALRQAVVDSKQHPDVRSASFRSLAQIEPEKFDDVATLRGLLTDGEARVRAFAAFELGARTGDAKDAVPDLLTGFNDMSHMVRYESAMAVARIAPGHGEAVLMLIAGVEDRLLLSPVAAAWALGEMGSKANAAVGALEKAADSENYDLAKAAEEALGKIKG